MINLLEDVLLRYGAYKNTTDGARGTTPFSEVVASSNLSPPSLSGDIKR